MGLGFRHRAAEHWEELGARRGIPARIELSAGGGRCEFWQHHGGAGMGRAGQSGLDAWLCLAELWYLPAAVRGDGAGSHPSDPTRIALAARSTWERR